MDDLFQNLVGIKFTDGGLTPAEGFYCYGLVRWVLGQGLGIWIPERAIGWRKFADVLPIAGPYQRFDVLMFSEKRDGLVDHVGVCDGHGNVIHCNRLTAGVVCEPVSRHLAKLVSVGRIRRAA